MGSFSSVRCSKKLFCISLKGEPPRRLSGKERAFSARAAGDMGLIPGLRRSPVEEAMATHSSILAWRTPWMEEAGGLQSIVSQRVRHNCSDRARSHSGIPWRGTQTLPQGCHGVSRLRFPCLCFPSRPWLATVWKTAMARSPTEHC